MNFYNPYFYTIPNLSTAPRVGLFSRLFGRTGITLSGILNGTQRALNFANQAIPLVKQVKPMIGNAKTMFKVMNEFKRVDTPKPRKYDAANKNVVLNNDSNKNDNIENANYDNGPTFFA